jgi:hypothetical protein
MEGKATNKMVVSRNTANTARLVLARTIQGLRSRGVSGTTDSDVVTCMRHLG